MRVPRELPYSSRKWCLSVGQGDGTVLGSLQWQRLSGAAPREVRGVVLAAQGEEACALLGEAEFAGTMDSWVQFSAQSQAKERLFRAAQYACTLLGYTLQKNGSSPDFIARIKQLEAHLSLGRKLFRLGNSADALEAAKRAIHLSDVVLRFCVTVSHLNRAMYFASDNILWAGKSGLIPHMDQEKWSQRSFRYYLFALIMNLTRDAYEVRLLMEREASGKCQKGGGDDGRALREDDRRQQLALRLKLQCRLLVHVLRNNPPLLLDVVKNTCDIFIPLDKLGLYKTNPGFVGLCGLTSSVLSILAIVYPWLKLKP